MILSSGLWGVLSTDGPVIWRTRLTDHQPARRHLLSVKALNGGAGALGCDHRHETKAQRLLVVAINCKIHVHDIAIGGK